MTENIYCLVRMRNRELNRDQKIWSVVRWQFRIERRSTLEPLWCNVIYGWTRTKFRFDPSSNLHDVGAARP